MEEQEMIETSLEALEESMAEVTEHAQQKWIQWAALSSAIMATIGAVTALLATFAAHEAVITETKIANEWARYQAKSIKSNVVETKISLLEALGKAVDPKYQGTIDIYDNEMAEIAADAKQLTRESAFFFDQHHYFAISLTLFQVAIAVCAISVLSRRKYMLYLSLCFSLLAIVFLIKGGPFSHPPNGHKEKISNLMIKPQIGQIPMDIRNSMMTRLG